LGFEEVYLKDVITLQCQRDLLQCQKRPTTMSKETYFEEVYLKDVITDLIKLVPTILSQ